MSQPPWERTQRTRARRRRSRGEPGGPPTRSRWSVLRREAAFLVMAIVGSMLVKAFLLQSFFIPSASMEPTLHGCPGCVSDRVLVNKLRIRTGGVHRGDVVVFQDPGGWMAHGFPSPAPAPQGRVNDVLALIGLAPSNGESDLVKRVIGVGGDTVEGRGGRVYVNGTLLVEPYLYPGDSPTEIDFKVTVPADNLWVMGDHRSNSDDSRYQQQKPGKGFVPVKDVLGNAFVIIWPLDRIGGLDRS